VHITLRNRDGDRCEAGGVAAEVRGSAALMLTAERTALNFLQRLSGIATLTRRFVDAAADGITVLDTRKTTPTLRALEKYAVRAGGGSNHRSGLDDGILIKDNHVRLAGGVAEAVKRMKAARQEMLIEVEAQSLADVEAAIDAAADVILLDNLPLEQIHQAVARIAGRAKIEISGGVSLDRMPELARTGADYVSIGALTHSAPAVDLSFEIELDA
jgi:nicotinate-nucleotide pyrophosphorylase (carboxylating)